MQKIMSVLLCCTLFATTFLAQSVKKERSPSEYQKDEAKARKNLADKDEAYQLIGQWQLAQLYADNNAPQYNCDSAWHYVNAIDSRFTKIKMEVKEKAFKKAELDSPKLRKLKETVVKAMFAQARKKRTITAYQEVLTATEKVKEYSLKKSRDSVRVLFNSAVMKIADTLQSIESIEAFRAQFPSFTKENASRNEQLDRKIIRLYFAKNGYADGSAFCKRFTQMTFCKDTAYANFIRTMQAHNEKGYQTFLERHAATSVFNEIVTDSLAITAMEAAAKNGSFADCLRLAAKFPNSHYINLLDDKISDFFLKTPQLYPFYELDKPLDLRKLPKTANAVYPVFANDGRADRFVWFERAFQNYPDTAQLRKDKELAKMLDATKIWNERDLYLPKMQNEYAAYIKAAAPKYMAFVALQKMIRADIDAKKWTEAAATVRTYQPYFGKDNSFITNLLELLESTKESDVTIVDIGESINTKEKDEIIPVLTIDNRKLFFCRYYLGEEDIYSAVKNEKEKWNFAYALAGLSEPMIHEAPLSISADGTSMVIFRDGILNETHKTIGGWSAPKNISENINSAVWQGAASLSPNGRVLIYESQRKEVLGYNSYVLGSTDYQNIDLFVSFCDSLGNWTKGVNLGKTINTFHCERSPYLHADMKTLYFSSDGHGGLGIRDVFKTTRLDDTWLNWSPPQNVGKEINTGGDDWGYVVSSSNVLGYFSADGNIQYITPLPKKAKATDVVLVKGKLTDSKNKRVTEGKVIVREMETNVIYMECNVDPDSGSYQMALPPGGRYSLEIVQQNALPQFDTIDTRQVTHFTERKVETRQIINFKEMKEQNIAVQLNNLFFNSKEAIIRNDSYLELNNLAKLIKANNWQIEILGHTDNVGSAETNKKLSEARAMAVKTYLVEKGCAANTIKTIGFGSSKPIADNKDETGRAKNRRVEIKIK